MSEPGSVYVLINASMQGLVKIGRTQRSPAERVKELSAATGVPTPFVHVFDAYFQDSVRAEAYVHTVLEGKNYRLTSNREFFVAPVKEAILALQAAEAFFNSEGISTVDSAPSRTTLPAEEAPWRSILELADAASMGSGGTLQDEEEALRLYKQAARLGSAEACLAAARILRLNPEFQDRKQALGYLKDGARLAHGDCHAEMAAMFAEDRHIANWKVCWANYFASESFRRRDFACGKYSLAYITQARELRLPMDHGPSIAEAKGAVLSAIDQMSALSQQLGQPSPIYEMMRHYARQAMGENEEAERLRGSVNWVNEKGSGFITLDTGEQAFFQPEHITSGEIAQGHLGKLRVHCRVIRFPNGLLAFDVRVA